MPFSQRKGLKPVKSVIQVDSMDDDFGRGLWNYLFNYYWNDVPTNETYLKDRRGVKHLVHSYDSDDRFYFLVRDLWLSYFKKTIDTLDKDWDKVYKFIRNYFFQCEWYETYDFIEFVANNYDDTIINNGFIKDCNRVLEKELSAYRFVGERIVEITTQEEITEIEQALDIPLKPVRDHLKSSLDKLADKKNPDYRNSIKEAISAVEALCKLITNNKKAKLNDALNKLESKVKLHPELKTAFTKLYNYTSDADGIRHALIDEPNLSFEDAKFMLVSCSAFVNYLVTKASKAGITI